MRLLILVAGLVLLGGCATAPAPSVTPKKPELMAVTDIPSIGIPKLKALHVKERTTLALAAAVYWTQHKEPGYAADYLAFLETISPDQRPSALNGQVAYLRGNLAYAAGDYEGALRFYRDAGAKFVDDEQWYLNALIQQETVEHVHGLLAAAIDTTDRILVLAEKKQAQLLQGRFYYERGMLLYKLQRLDEATVAARQAADAFKGVNSQTGVAECEKLFGNLASGRGNLEEALKHYDDAYMVFKATGNMLEAANCRFNAGLVLGKQHEFQRAEASLDDGILLFTRAGALGGVGLCHQAKGDLALEKGDLLLAERELRDAERIFTETHDAYRLARTKMSFAGLYKKRNDPVAAADYRTQAELLYQKVNAR